MSNKHGKLPPFTAIFRHTTKSAAWAVLSVGARATFVILQSLHNTNAQNAVFLSKRDGAKQLGGVRPDNVSRWLDELEHYGFTVMVQDHHRGASGKGKSATYRLTDRYYAGKPPTYDFQNWNGARFAPKPKPKAKSAGEIARLNDLRRHHSGTRPVPPWHTAGAIMDVS
jgi:hypothetical protein